MKRSIHMVAFVFLLSGCATGGQWHTSKTQTLDKKVNTVSIKDNALDRITPWTPDIKDLMIQRMTVFFQRSGFRVVDQDADLSILIKDIQAENCTINFPIIQVSLVGVMAGKEVLTSDFSQQVGCFTLKSTFLLSRELNQIAEILARDIIKQIR